MTVQKRPRTQEALDMEIPAELLAELEKMNQQTNEASGTTYVTAEPEDAQIDDEPQPPADYNELVEYRLDILGRAAHAVTRDRNQQYGAPEQTFERIAALWCAYLGIDTLMGTDVAAMMVLMKVARLATNPLHEDSWLDIAGYAACGASVAKDLAQHMEEEQS